MARTHHSVTLLVLSTLAACEPKASKMAEPAAPSSAPAQPSVITPEGAPQSVIPVSLQRGAPHGSLESQKQQELLEKLLRTPGAEALDPSYWTALEPEDNRGNPSRIALGNKLYFDPRLSRDGSVSCATCHDVSRGFTDQRNASEGIDGQVGRRNAPTTLNALFFQTQFLDGRAVSLEDQAKLPIINPIEMGHPSGDAAVAAIKEDPEYQAAFQAAYGRDVNYDDIGRALAAFERTLVFLDAPIDRYTRGAAQAVSQDAQAGWALFHGKARCVSCHQFNDQNPIGTNNKFHNIGVSARHQNFEAQAGKALAELAKDDSQTTIDRLALETDASELGRFLVSRNRADIGAFKTSQLRNIGITAPYMHDGSLGTLWDVIDHYNKGGEANPYLDGGIEPLNLSDREVDQLVAFLFTLTDYRFAEMNQSELERQRQVAQSKRPFKEPALASRSQLPFEARMAKGNE